MHALNAYLPRDRWRALAEGRDLPDRTRGAAMMADISGFTPLADSLAEGLGARRGAEELTLQLNEVYDAVISEVDRYRGSVIGFSGDAITCWFEADQGMRAAACALVMQQAMNRFAAVKIPSGQSVELALKVAVASGEARRFLVGDASIQYLDVLAGGLLTRLAETEHLSRKGEVVVERSTADRLNDCVRLVDHRRHASNETTCAVISGLKRVVGPAPWPEVAADRLDEALLRSFILPAVYQRLRSGQGEFLTELRPAVALFLKFEGLDYDADEDSGLKLDRYIKWVQKLLARYEGFLIDVTFGDKGSYLYAAFGAPVAHEDDAHRAVAAAWELRNIPPEFDFIRSVQIGLSQGTMRTGAYGGTTRRTYGVLGHEVNLAARLMERAFPGQVLVSGRVQQADADSFGWKALPMIKVKGKTGLVPVFAWQGIQQPRSVRLQEPAYALPMVGRALELALISQKLELTLASRGQVVGVTAEAGMGKSRLIAEVIRLARERGIVGFAGQSQSYGTKTSYHLWSSLWRDLFEIEPGATVDEQIACLEKRLHRLDPSLVQRLPLLGPVLKLPIPENAVTRSLDPKVRKTALEALLVECVRARARQNPLLFVLEDCHWIDPLSQDLLESIARSVSESPVILLLAYRPATIDRGQRSILQQMAHFTELCLLELDPHEAEQLIRLKLSQLYGAEPDVPASLIERLTARAQGNPFYIEELLNYLQDRGIDPKDTSAVEALDLPTSLHRLILSRIDQLTDRQKITLKVASVIGRVFKLAMLEGIYPPPAGPQEIRSDLEELKGLDLTPLDTPEPDLTYLFKHIVTQEVAYETLAYATRALLHAQVGQFIERTCPNLDQHLDLLAFHYDRSDQEDKKRHYLLMAGEAAQRHYANSTAIDYYQRLLPLLPESQQLSVLLKQGQVFELLGRWQEADGKCQNALKLAERFHDRLGQAWCQIALAELRRKQGNYADAANWLAQAQTGFTELKDESGLAQALHYDGTLAAQQGDYPRAKQLYQKSLAIRRQLQDKPQLASLLSNLGIIARFQGDYPQARSLHEEALVIRRELNDRWAIAISLNNLGNVALDQGDYTAARAWLAEAVALKREVGEPWAIAVTLDNLGNVARAQGDYADARSLYAESLALSRQLGDKWALAYLLEDIGGLAALEGRAVRAFRLIGFASALRDSIGAPRSPAEQSKLERILQPALKILTPAECEIALNQGRAISLPQAIDYVCQEDL